MVSLNGNRLPTAVVLLFSCRFALLPPAACLFSVPPLPLAQAFGLSATSLQRLPAIVFVVSLLYATCNKYCSRSSFRVECYKYLLAVYFPIADL